MRVALVGPYPLDTEWFGGGVETSISYLARALGATPDVDVHVVTLTPDIEGLRSVDASGFRVHYVPTGRRLKTLTFHRADRRTLAAFFDELGPDVIHAQDALSYGYSCLKAAGPIPVVVTIHGIVAEELRYVTGWSARTRTRFAVALQRYCVGHARYLTQSTRYPERYFGGLVRGHIFDTGNPISDEHFAVEPHPEPGRILYSGFVIPRKRLLDLLDALPEVLLACPEAHLHVAGGFTDRAYEGSVKERIHALGLQSSVTLLGHLSPRQLLDEYARCSVVVLPSGQETSPLAIGEAMAVGVPVVATRAGGVPDLVADGETGFVVEIGGPPALADRIVRVLVDDHLRAGMAHESRRRAESRFRAEVVARRTMEVYSSALAEQGTA